MLLRLEANIKFKDLNLSSPPLSPLIYELIGGPVGLDYMKTLAALILWLARAEPLLMLGGILKLLSINSFTDMLTQEKYWYQKNAYTRRSPARKTAVKY